MINAGFTGSGGYISVMRLAGTTKDIGLRSIAVVDGDLREDAKKFVKDNQDLADTIIRLPDGSAIELALLADLADEVMRQALCDAASSAGLIIPARFDQISGNQLTNATSSFMKSNSLHAQFVEALSPENLPPLAVRVLAEAVQAATNQSMGITQL